MQAYVRDKQMCKNDIEIYEQKCRWNLLHIERRLLTIFVFIKIVVSISLLENRSRISDFNLG